MKYDLDSIDRGYLVQGLRLLQKEQATYLDDPSFIVLELIKKLDKPISLSWVILCGIVRFILAYCAGTGLAYHISRWLAA